MKQFAMYNFQKAKEDGFTLIEMLAVIAIFVVVGSIAMAILISSFRTAQKTDTVNAVQNSGNYAILQMSKTLRNARSLVSPFPCSPPVKTNSISVLTPDNQNVTFTCILVGVGGPTIASNGASLLDTNQVNLTSCSFTCSQESDSDLPIITINFSLLQKSSSSFAEQIASKSAVVFQTSIGIRNINR